MPVVVIVFWEMPIWLLVLAGLCVLGVSACEYIPIICAIVTFLISLVSMNVSASSTLEKRKAAQPVGFKKRSAVGYDDLDVIFCEYNDVCRHAGLC